MAAGKVSFELVAPERILAREAVDMVVIPGAEGDFGVLAGQLLHQGTDRVFGLTAGVAGLPRHPAGAIDGSWHRVILRT